MKREQFRFVWLIISVLLIASIAPLAGAINSPNQPVNNDSICIYLFYSTSCPHCDQVENFLSQAEENYSLEVKKYRAAEHSELKRNLSQSFEIPQNRQGYVPTGFIGTDYCVGAKDCINLFQSYMGDYKKEGLACPSLYQGEDQVETPLTVIGISSLAFLDAINPCAIAVLLILLTAIMTKYPDNKRKALQSGLFFSLAILLCYYLIGSLIVFGFKSVSNIASLSLGIFYKALGVLAIIIGVFNIKDWVEHGLGGFVMEVPFSWRPKMKEIIKSVTSPPGAFLIGVIVSLFLLPCTSGPYFVAGGILSSIEWSSALSWLLLYNFIFIIPMLVISFGVYGGFASVESVSEWRENNIRKLHLVAGAVLAGLGFGLVFSSFSSEVVFVLYSIIGVSVTLIGSFIVRYILMELKGA